MYISNYEYGTPDCLADFISTDEALAVVCEETKQEVIIEHFQGDCINLISGDNKRAIASLVNDDGVYKLVVFSDVDSYEYTHSIDVTEAVTGNK